MESTNLSNQLIGREFTNYGMLVTKIVDISNDVPSECTEQLLNWLKYKTIEVGVGRHYDTYLQHNDCCEIGICYDVSFKPSV